MDTNQRLTPHATGNAEPTQWTYVIEDEAIAVNIGGEILRFDRLPGRAVLFSRLVDKHNSTIERAKATRPQPSKASSPLCERSEPVPYSKTWNRAEGKSRSHQPQLAAINAADKCCNWLQTDDDPITHDERMTCAKFIQSAINIALDAKRQRAEEATGAYKAEVRSHQRTNDLLTTERQQVKRIAEFVAEVVNKAKDLQDQLNNEKQLSEDRLEQLRILRSDFEIQLSDFEIQLEAEHQLREQAERMLDLARRGSPQAVGGCAS